MLTLEQILQEIGGYVDQDTSTPTGTDLTTRSNYVNRALREWGSAYDWEQLTVKQTLTASSISSVSFALPSNFRKPMSAVYLYDASVPTCFTIIDPAQRFDVNRYYGSTDFVAYTGGNPSTGYYINIPKGIASGASLVMDIQIYPSSLATLNNIPPIDDPEYLVDRGIAYVLEARSDSRFPTMKANADRKLSTMVERQNSGNKGKPNSIPMNVGFSIGYD